ncbi:MAG: phage head closure protein [Defluviitaleaceae bacterium]|nr:phage head closure protein [Defluviitaleaceae bacterium]MCL2263961.1 phage head closure protein [Defluviitaleaceae bacterium]
MTVGKLRERIGLYKVISPQGAHQIFNPSRENVEFLCNVWTKREDKIQAARWNAMETLNILEKKQFIIRHRKDLSTDMAVEFGDKLYKVLAVQDLDNMKQWTMLLTGAVCADEGWN